MKSILIIGASDAGKSTTMREVCKRLKPTKVFSLHINKEDYKKSELKESKVESIFNDTFIIEYNNKFILVVAGAPTEQRIKLTILIEICIELKIEISFMLISKRVYERLEGYNTVNEIKKKSEIILTEKIYRIKDSDFDKTTEWNNRIDKIVTLIKSNI